MYQYLRLIALTGVIGFFAEVASIYFLFLSDPSGRGGKGGFPPLFHELSFADQLQEIIGLGTVIFVFIAMATAAIVFAYKLYGESAHQQ